MIFAILRQIFFFEFSAPGFSVSGVADTNFLTGSNDIIAVRKVTGPLAASPFSVQFGKKDVWLPRSGHQVKMKVNSVDVPVEMILDSVGRAYFPTTNITTATAGQLGEMGLRPGVNRITFSVETYSGSQVTAASNIYLLDNNARIVVSDIDGTVTKWEQIGNIIFSSQLFQIQCEGVSPARPGVVRLETRRGGGVVQ